MSPDRRHARIARNEASFRDINDRLEQGLRHVQHTEQLQEFICECGNRECEQLIALTFDEYEAVRRDSRHFATVPGHVIPDAEHVVAHCERYDVVEKDGDAVPFADAADRRAPDGVGLRDS
jgi:hypothetical protein